MSIINNARPGSDIGSLCTIFRVLLRNNKTYTRDEIRELCAPAHLAKNRNQGKKFTETFDFWEKFPKPLWREFGKSKTIELVNVPDDDSPESISTVVHEVLFTDKIDDLIGSFNNSDPTNSAHFFIALAAVYGADSHLFPNRGVLDGNAVNKLFQQMNGVVKPPNDANEKGPFRAWGQFLGYFETVPNESEKYYADPSRVVRSLLPAIFKAKRKLPARIFIDQLGKLAPVLDHGTYRKQIEDLVDSSVFKTLDQQEVSKTLSFALERLIAANDIRFETLADDPNAVSVQLSNATPRVSEIEWLRP